MGKQVNALRKLGGKASTRAKALVKKWKQLLPSEVHHSADSASSCTGHRSDVTEHESLALRGLRGQGLPEPVPHLQDEGGSDCEVVSTTTPPATYSKKKHRKDKERKRKRVVAEQGEEQGSFARALEMPVPHNRVSSKHQRHLEAKTENHRTELPDVTIVGMSPPSSRGVSAGVLRRERSPMPNSKSGTTPQRELTAGVKRKGVC